MHPRFSSFVLIAAVIVFYSQSALADEQQKAAISFGCVNDYSFLSSSGTEKISGFDLELIKTISDIGDFQSTVKDGTRAQLLEMLQDGEIDSVSGIVMTQPLAKRFDFSIPYLTEYYSIFIRADLSFDEAASLMEYICACPEGDPVLDTFIIPNNLDQNLVEAASFYNAFELVKRGAADYVVAPVMLGQSFANEFDIKEFELYDRPLLALEYRFAVEKNSSSLFLINEALFNASRQGVITSLKNNTDYFTRFSASAGSLRLRFWLVILMISITLAVNLIIFNILKKRSDSRLKQAVEEFEISRVADAQNEYADESKNTCDEMLAKLDRMVLDLSLKDVENERLRITDGTTLLYNNSYIERRIRDEIERYKMYGQKFCVISLELQERSIEDAVTASQIVRDIIRRSDVAGYNGNGLVVIILPKTSISQAEELLRKISLGLFDKVDFSGTVYNLPVEPGNILSPEIEELCRS